MNKLTHFDKSGSAIMVDVSDKNITSRLAIASAEVIMQRKTLNLIKNKGHKKGDVLSVARIAGILAAKQTHNLIPLCHPILIESVNINFKYNIKNNSVLIESVCKTFSRTGIEMEALTACSVAALTVYDMCKSVDKAIEINNLSLKHKSGGKSGTYNKI